MSYLLSIDPGLRKCGSALWRNGQLVAAQLIVGDARGSLDEAGVVEKIVSEIETWVQLESSFEFLRYQNSKMVCEYPRTYGGRAKKGDANDLVGVALVAGAVLGRLACPSRLVLPEDWKGSAPKPQGKAEYLRDGYVVEQRATLKLSSGELTRVRLPGKDWRKALDVWDAVGIGLWALGR